MASPEEVTYNLEILATVVEWLLQEAGWINSEVRLELEKHLR